MTDQRYSDGLSLGPVTPDVFKRKLIDGNSKQAKVGAWPRLGRRLEFRQRIYSMLEVVPFRVSIGALSVPSLSLRIGLTTIVVISAVICVPPAVSRRVATWCLSSLMVWWRLMMAIVWSRVTSIAILRIVSIAIDTVVAVVSIAAPLSGTRCLLEVG